MSRLRPRRLLRKSDRRKEKRALRRLTQNKKVIRRYRYDISNEAVLAKLAEGWSVRKCCDYFRCSKNLIEAVAQGIRPEPSPLVNKRKIKPEDLCTCCALRPKRKGLRFLCEYCFENQNIGVLDIHHVDHYTAKDVSSHHEEIKWWGE